MLELQLVSASVHGCFARPEALDLLAVPAAISVRSAPDELLLVDAAPGSDPEADLAAIDPGGFVLDLTDGFAIWALRGDGRHEAFARLSALEPPPIGAVAQGLFAHAPAKLVARADEYLVLVSAAVSHHVRDRLHAACSEDTPTELPSARLTPQAGEAP